MKILVVIQCTNLGGMEQCALLLARELMSLGVDVEFLSLNPLGALAPLLQDAGIPATSAGYRGFAGWRSFRATRRILRANGADAMIMVGHNLMAMLAAGSKWRGRQILCMHFHHTGVKRTWSWRLIYGLAAHRFRAIVFPSEFIFDEACRIAPFIRQKGSVVANPIVMPRVSTEHDMQAARFRLGLKPSDKIVGNAGWLISRKRWDVFLNVAAEVARQVPNAQFVIAGDGPDRGELERQTEQLGLNGRVRWLGWQKDLADFYLALDVMLFNSDFDAMGRTPLEAMSYGVPLVGSVVNCGLPEVIDCDDVGILLRNHDIPTLSAHVIRLLRDQESARALGQRGRARVEEISCPRRHASELLRALGVEPSHVPSQLVGAI